jgi:hypothetical protein
MVTALGHMQLQPEWLAHRYDDAADAVHFVRADRALRRQVPFLTDEHLPGAVEPLAVGRVEALSAAPAAAPLHFIFHSAYCCSTLLANALDIRGAASTLKEPVILNDLVGWRHRGAQPARLGEVLDGALRLLSRPFEAGEACIAKPSNLLNSLAPAFLTLRPQARAILLHAPLEVYLGSIAAKGLWGRIWVRDLLVKQLKDRFIDLGFEPEDHLRQSDLQVAAVGWLAQHQLFARLAAEHGDRVRTCDSEALLDQPAEALAAAVRLFGLSVTEAALHEAVDGAFTRHAKFGNAFNREDRLAAQRQAAAAHRDEIDKVMAWARVVADSAGVDLHAPRPLLDR